MLHILQGRSQNCEGMHRRDFLRVGALAGLGVSLPQLLAAQSSQNRRGRDVSCILVWTRGGTSHHDTFDPKPDATSAVRGEFGTIATAVPGVRFSDVTPRLARELNRFAVLRSLNPRNGSHGTADYIMMSGHRFNASLVHPCYGSVISQQRGFKTRMPPFVQAGKLARQEVRRWWGRHPRRCP